MSSGLTNRNIKTTLSVYGIEGPEVDVNELVLDSREVAVHSVFVAVKGHNLDGRNFIPQAISLGARMVLQEVEQPSAHGQLEMREQTVIISFYQLSANLSKVAATFYGQPAEMLDVIAVTGTNGKTSTVQLISQLRHLSGDAAASIGTLGAGLYTDNIESLEKTLNTTPDACQMQRLLAGFVAKGAKQVALEASSHALVQGRIEGLKTDVAVFTNLTRDHLDYHSTMEEYARAKRLLLEQPGLKHIIVNLDDSEAKNWINAASQEKSITVLSSMLSPEKLNANWQYCVAQNIQFHSNGLSFLLRSSWGDAQISCALLGNFNVSNLLAAMASMLVLGHSVESLANACEQVKPVAGRMELFSTAKKGNLIVDYAHTPDALEQALVSARMHCRGTLFSVFGCGGDRDKGKRPMMGKIAQQFSDKVYVTTDNSRSEVPRAIVADILQDTVNADEIVIELDRKVAIKQALEQSSSGDLVLVAGKGHETTQIIGEHSLPYDEREYVKTLSLEK